MGHGNVAEFILLGLFTVENAEVACFVLFLLCYIAILSGNLLILLTIGADASVNSPCTFSQLFVLDGGLLHLHGGTQIDH